MSCFKSFLKCFKRDNIKAIPPTMFTNNPYWSQTNNISKTNFNKSDWIHLKQDILKNNFLQPTPSNKTNKIITPFRNSSSTKIIDSKLNTRNNNDSFNRTPKNPNDNINKKNKQILFDLKDRVRCVFCFGRSCKHEDYRTNKNAQNAIKGLNSNWITNDIIASQRPSEIWINTYNLVHTFKEFNIGLIINLQREGEHPYCGPNAYNWTSSGYTYNPSVFTGDDIKCKLSGWKDMSVPTSMNFMLDIVKEMTVTVKEEQRKVWVHCHAGYGRTGVVIACYLIYNLEDTSVDTIIHLIRSKRKKCIESSEQIAYCHKFSNYIKNIRRLFNDNTKEKIEHYLKFQEDWLCGMEEIKYGLVPMWLTRTLERIIQIQRTNKLTSMEIYKYFLGYYTLNITFELNEVLSFLKASINKSIWDWFYRTDNINIIIILIFQWATHDVFYIINPIRTSKIIDSPWFKEIESPKYENSYDKEMYQLLKTNYHCFEYETIFQVAEFFMNFIPQNTKEKDVFLNVWDVFSVHWLGYDYKDMIENNISKDSNFYVIKRQVTGWSTIINFIVFTVATNQVEEELFKSSRGSYRNKSKKNSYNTINNCSSFRLIRTPIEDNQLLYNYQNNLPQSCYQTKVGKKGSFHNPLHKTLSQFNNSNSVSIINTANNQINNWSKLISMDKGTSSYKLTVENNNNNNNTNYYNNFIDFESRLSSNKGDAQPPLNISCIQNNKMDDIESSSWNDVSKINFSTNNHNIFNIYVPKNCTLNTSPIKHHSSLFSAEEQNKKGVIDNVPFIAMEESLKHENMKKKFGITCINEVKPMYEIESEIATTRNWRKTGFKEKDATFKQMVANKGFDSTKTLKSKNHNKMIHCIHNSRLPKWNSFEK